MSSRSARCCASSAAAACSASAHCHQPCATHPCATYRRWQATDDRRQACAVPVWSRQPSPAHAQPRPGHWGYRLAHRAAPSLLYRDPSADNQRDREDRANAVCSEWRLRLPHHAGPVCPRLVAPRAHPIAASHSLHSGSVRSGTYGCDGVTELGRGGGESADVLAAGGCDGAALSSQSVQLSLCGCECQVGLGGILTDTVMDERVRIRDKDV
jgi:hypothetical protein